MNHINLYTSLTSLTLLKISWKSNEMNLQYYWNILHKACSMQQCISDIFDMPWILQNLLFSQTSFWQESFLHVSNHWPDSWPELSPLIFAKSCPGCQNYPVLTGLAVKMSNSLSLLVDFTEIRPVLASLMSPTLKLLTQNLYLSDLIMPKPVFLMTVQEAHKEYNSLIDQIQAKYELLDSGRVWVSWHPSI